MAPFNGYQTTKVNTAKPKSTGVLMKRDRLLLSGNMSIETDLDFNGRFYICFAKSCSIMARDPKDVRRFLKLPVKTPSREAVDSWLASLAAADDERQKRKTLETSGLTEQALQTGFGPECHLDESDPNHQTRTVI